MKSKKIWINGKIRNSSAENDFFYYVSLHYGLSIFDGILCLKDIKRRNSRIFFRLHDHIDRIFYSAKILGLIIPYSKEEIIKAVFDLIKLTGYGCYYIRPLIFSSQNFTDKPLLAGRKFINAVILYKKFDFWKFALNMNRKVRITVSKKVKNTWSEVIAGAKISGKYLNCFMALAEAREKKFDDAVILDETGKVSEASTSNIFFVKDNLIKTPPAKRCLRGITRASVIEITKNLGYQMKEDETSIDDLYNAAEIFLTNTATGIISVSKLDGTDKIYSSNTTSIIRKKYLKIISGKDENYSQWLTKIII